MCSVSDATAGATAPLSIQANGQHCLIKAAKLVQPQQLLAWLHMPYKNVQ
jgi:hypothetical protein